MTVLKTLKQFRFVKLVKTNPIMGGEYAVINGDKVKDGLSLESTRDLYNTLKN